MMQKAISRPKRVLNQLKANQPLHLAKMGLSSKNVLASLSLCVALILNLPLAMAESKSPATDFLKERVAAVLSLTALACDTPKEKGEIDAKLLGAVKPMMDFPAMSEASLGKYWTTLKDDQRQSFIKLFQELVFHSYMKKIRSAKRDAKIEYEDENSRAEGGAEVEAVATTHKGVEVELRFILRAGKAKTAEAAFVAEDIVIDEVSLVSNYRDEFSRIIAKDGFDTLLKKMEKQVAKVKTDK